jgi:hypothetical protein
VCRKVKRVLQKPRKVQNKQQKNKIVRKYYSEIIFISPDMVRAKFQVGTKRVSALLRAETFNIRQTFKMMINLPKLPKKGEAICLLNEEQIKTILFDGEGGDRFETDEQIQNAFTFDVYIHRGYPLGSSGGEQKWIGLYQNSIYSGDASMLSDARVDHNTFIVTQLVRFKVLDKLKLANKTA